LSRHDTNSTQNSEQLPVRPTHSEAIAFFQNIIDNAWREPSADNAAAKAQLDYFCGHIDGAHGLKDFIPFKIVSTHYTALHPSQHFNPPTFNTALRSYLALLNADFNNEKMDAFREATVSLTFDRARHERNITRFSVASLTLKKTMNREPSRNDR
jgi:hypothetical protein